VNQRVLDEYLCNVHSKCMAVRTISLKTEAYERLKAARRYPTESFSEVVLRATWPEDTVTAGGLLALLRTSPPWLTDDELAMVETAKAADVPPEDKWAGR
jgi:Putative antitoxin